MQRSRLRKKKATPKSKQWMLPIVIIGLCLFILLFLSKEYAPTTLIAASSAASNLPFDDPDWTLKLDEFDAIFPSETNSTYSSILVKNAALLEARLNKFLQSFNSKVMLEIDYPILKPLEIELNSFPARESENLIQDLARFRRGLADTAKQLKASALTSFKWHPGNMQSDLMSFLQNTVATFKAAADFKRKEAEILKTQFTIRMMKLREARERWERIRLYGTYLFGALGLLALMYFGWSKFQGPKSKIINFGGRQDADSNTMSCTFLSNVSMGHTHVNCSYKTNFPEKANNPSILMYLNSRFTKMSKEKLLYPNVKNTNDDKREIEAIVQNIDLANEDVKEIERLMNSLRLIDNEAVKNYPTNVIHILNEQTNLSSFVNDREIGRYLNSCWTNFKPRNKNNHCLVFYDEGDIKNMITVNPNQWSKSELQQLLSSQSKSRGIYHFFVYDGDDSTENSQTPFTSPPGPPPSKSTTKPKVNLKPTSQLQQQQPSTGNVVQTSSSVSAPIVNTSNSGQPPTENDVQTSTPSVSTPIVNTSNSGQPPTGNVVQTSSSESAPIVNTSNSGQPSTGNDVQTLTPSVSTQKKTRPQVKPKPNNTIQQTVSSKIT